MKLQSMVKLETRQAFQGTNVLITGASSGLGKSLACTLARDCNVKTLILSARRPDALEQVAALCREQQQQQQQQPAKQEEQDKETIKIHIIPCDLADPQSVSKLGQTAMELCDTIHVLINNGGVSSRSKFIDTDIAVDASILQINFLAGAALAKMVVPTMIQHNNNLNKKKLNHNHNHHRNHNNDNHQDNTRIIWISSVQGLVGIPNRSSYAASKFAVQGYCESIRAELHGQGIAVHTVSPGYINTNLSRSAVTGQGQPYGQMDATTASGADPDDLAVTILDQVAAGQVDFTVAAPVSAVVAIWLRLLCPRILRKLLVQRYEKSEKEKKD